MRLSHLNFDPPGPGLWSTDGLHAYRPVTAIGMTNRFAGQAGMRISMSRYGSLGEGMMGAVLHRFGYGQMRMLVSRPPGPAHVAKKRFDAQVKANPEIQERLQRAEDALNTKRWRSDVNFWDTVSKPWLMKRTYELTDMHPSSMDDAGLCVHIDEVLYHLGRSMEHHHILNLVHGTPRGLLILHTHDWAGLDSSELESLLVGSSPISAGDEPELRELTSALKDDEAAITLIDGEDNPAERLDALCNREGAVGKTATQYIRTVGYRTIEGWESMNPYILEQPALLIKKIRHPLAGSYACLDQEVLANVRDKVPDEHRSYFDELLQDARRYNRIKDERDIYCNIPIGGLLRRAVIEAGRRAAERGKIHTKEHMTDAGAGEIRDLLLGAAGPDANELQDRYSYRQTYTIRDVPASIGAPDQEPIDPDWLPRGARMFALMIALQRDGTATTESTGEEIRGKSASPGSYKGIARVLQGANELHRIEQGDVLITSATNPAFNVVLPQLGALVTAYGGILSHAAIVAREFGLPAVVGCKDVTEKIADGSYVLVDGDTGTVTLLD